MERDYICKEDEGLKNLWRARIIADACFFEGVNDTIYGNYIFYVSELENEYGWSIDKKMIELITERLLESSYVLDVEYHEDDGRYIDVNFSTIFAQVEEG